jgi:methylated-DNA-protein-cysteine methyltransferase-like protein
MPESFRDKVYALAKQIPPGKVTTYGQLARLVGSPGAARAVGMCMKQNPDNKTIPCHRVVSSDGKLTGYAFGGTVKKEEILRQEGVYFTNGHVDLAKSLWQPE